MTGGDFEHYWFSWHRNQEQMYETGAIEDDRKNVFTYCTEVFSKHQDTIEAVIEIGVGNGFLLDQLYRINPKISYYGLDRNKPILVQNSQKFPHLNFVHGDAVEILSTMKVPQRVFLFAIATLEYLTEKELGALFRAIRENFSNGFFLFSVVSGPDAMFSGTDSILVKNDPFDTKYAHFYKKLILAEKFNFLEGKIYHCRHKDGNTSEIHVFTLDLCRK